MDISNDSLVLPILNQIIADEKEGYDVKAFAYLQLFLYYLYAHDYDSAEQTLKDGLVFALAASAQKDGESKSTMASSLFGTFMFDGPSILNIARILSEKSVPIMP